MANELDLNQAQVSIAVDMGEVHDISLDLLRSLEDAEVDLTTAAAALAMSLGRVLSPRVLEQEDEERFMQNMFEWASMYFTDGKVN